MQSLFPDLAAVAFDLDDTLFDREKAVRSLLHVWLGDIPSATLEEILLRDAGGHSAREPFFDWLGKIFPELGGDLWQCFRAEIAKHVVADPWARPLLQRITANGLALGLLTNGGTTHQFAKLQATGLAGFFFPERILISEALGLEKPDSKAFAALSTALHLPPERILFIGDHPMTDIAGAKSAGFRTCWLRRRGSAGIGGEADLVVDSLESAGLIFSDNR